MPTSKRPPLTEDEAYAMMWDAYVRTKQAELEALAQEWDQAVQEAREVAEVSDVAETADIRAKPRRTKRPSA